MKLEAIRGEIDKIDKQLKDLLHQRLEMAEQVADYKLAADEKIFKPEREEQVIQQFLDGIQPEKHPEFAAFIKKVMEISRAHQYKRMIAQGKNFELPYTEQVETNDIICYQGLEGSYSHEATVKMFPRAQHYPVSTFKEVFERIKAGRAHIGVLPLENSTAGTVDEVYDLLIHNNLYINHCTIIKVEHCLAGHKGAVLENIKKVYSHQQAIRQSQEFLDANGITAVESSNTAVAAKELGEKVGQSCGAICSKEAAKRYGLTVLAENINQQKNNATKFIAISRQLTVAKEHNRISIAFACPHTSGSLASVLGIFGDYGINLTEIHSRPDGKNPWNYLFYLDFSGNLAENKLCPLFYQLEEELPYIKILGSYEMC